MQAKRTHQRNFGGNYFKTVGGDEGNHCNYPTRLDTYGCGCQHDCKYCYAKSLLDFRGLWNPRRPSIADVKNIKKAVQSLPEGCVVRLGGMTDCFQPMEKVFGVTKYAIECLNARKIPYLIVTKSDLVADDIYINAMDKRLAHIQISITCTSDEKYISLDYEKAPLPSRRIDAIEKLSENGFDVQVRLSPFIPQFIDFDRLNAIRCDKILVEFLRVNSWIEKWFDMDFSEYTVRQGAYRHLPLERKMELMKNITGFQRVSVCEDENTAYDYWKNNFNPNREDCCDLIL